MSIDYNNILMDWKKLKSNPEFWRIFKKRAEIIEKTRRFFKKGGFLEVQTPSLVPSLIPESYLEIFATELKDKMGRKWPAYLTPSPELWHKKLLVAGATKIFEITKSFRNTDIGGSLHNPEFTLLEWYRTNADHWTTMKDCENLIRFLASSAKKITYQGKTIRLDQPFERITVAEAFRKYAGKTPGSDQDFEVTYVRDIEPQLGQKRPTLIYNYPARFAPLAKTNSQDPGVKERFELYLFGIEIADAYNELTDPVEQRQQFKKEIRQRKKLGKTNHPVDWDFVKALEEGLPSCSGVALGIDRLVMIFTNQTKISQVILFAGAEIFSD